MEINSEYLRNLLILADYRESEDWELISTRLNAITTAYIDGDLTNKQYEALLTYAFTGREVLI